MKRVNRQTKRPARLRKRPLGGADPFFRRSVPGKSLAIGAAGTLLLHALLLAVFPERLSEPRESATAPRVFDISLSDPEETVRPPDEYVATNPDVPTNPPDDTPRIASRDQQAAQEEPPEDRAPEDTPRIEGEPLRSQNIVEGDPDPVPPAGGAFPGDQSDQDPAEPGDDLPLIPERLPVAGLDDVELDPDAEGLRTETAEEEDGDDVMRMVGINVPEGQRTSPSDGSTRLSADRPTPSPRPTLPRTHSGPVADRQGATSRVGEVAIDARRSDFGVYLERMLESIERQWLGMARAHASAADMGARVRVRFTLDSSGYVTIVDIDSTASQTGTLICQDAIEARAPFGEWSNEMVELMGEEQTMTITFHYR